jgi:hypothetical protein
VTIEASDDLEKWVTVGTTVAVDGVTTWKPPEPSSAFGHFFRIALKP